MSAEKMTYEELIEENRKLKVEKVERQKAAMHTIREMSLTLTHLCGVNKLPVKIELDFDWDRKDFDEYTTLSMIR